LGILIEIFECFLNLPFVILHCPLPRLLTELSDFCWYITASCEQSFEAQKDDDTHGGLMGLMGDL